MMMMTMMMMTTTTTTMMMDCGLNFPNTLLNGGISSVETLGFAGNLAFTYRKGPLMKLP
jgi:hypothetical protein